MLILPGARSTPKLPIPHEPGEWVQIQRLAWAELPSPNLRMTNVNAYIAELFKKAIVAWSYPQAPTSDVVREDKTVAPAFACLDDFTSDWLLGEINKLNNHVDREGSQGNATAPSIAS
jgi:hypothetical protein